MDINKLILNFIQKAKKLVNSIWGGKKNIDYSYYYISRITIKLQYSK